MSEHKKCPYNSTPCEHGMREGDSLRRVGLGCFRCVTYQSYLDTLEKGLKKKTNG